MAKTVNYSDSMNDVVSTVAPALKAFIDDVVKKEMSDCNFVYDQELSYETAMRKFRSDSQMNSDTSDPLPLFVFRRTALRWNDIGAAPHRRLTSAKAITKNLSDGKAVIYTPLFAEFDIDFIYLNKTMEDIEKFEITYLSDEGISGTREVTVYMEELGEFKYFLDFPEPAIDQLEINIQDNFYKAILGTIRMRGMFFTFRSESSIIKKIDLNTKSWLNSVTDNGNIELDIKEIT